MHMLFVFFPIWAVYLDKGKTVVEMKKLFPFISVYTPKNPAKYVLELVKKPEIKMGDTVEWE